MSDALDPRSVQELIELINDQNLTNFQVGDIAPGTPAKIIAGTRNTMVEVVAVPGSQYNGSLIVYYNRITLTQLGYVGIYADKVYTPAELLDAISELKGIGLYLTDFDDPYFPFINMYSYDTITLRSKDTAIKWQGQVQVEVALGIPRNLGKLYQLVNHTLPDSYLE